MCYSADMRTLPVSIRLDKRLRSFLSEGAARTPLNKQELVRRTLRRHLRQVIEEESVMPSPRITAVEPWPRGALARAYRRVGRDWDRIETTAAAAQVKPSWED